MSELKNKAEEYIQEVCNQIRWKKVHDPIAEELVNHIDDQKRAFIKAGQNAKEAEINAIAQMGDAVMVGQELDRTHRPTPEWSIVAIIGVCIVISLAAQYIIAINAFKSEFVSQECFWDYLKMMPFGIGILLAIYFADYSILGKYPKSIYGATLGVCALLYNVDSLRGFGTYRHVFYFAIVLMALYAGIIYSQRDKGYRGLLFCGAIGVITVAVFMYASALFSALLFTISGAIMLTVVIIKNWYRVDKKKALMLVWLPIVFTLTLAFCSGWERIRNLFINDDIEYSCIIARKLLAGSQFIGQGNIAGTTGTEIERFLPVWYNDFSLTYFIYKFGWIVGLIVVLLVVVLLVRMFEAVKKQTSMLGYIVSLSAAMTISIQCALFLFLNLGITSQGGCSLPILFAGRTDFLINMALFGLLLSAYRNKDIYCSKLSDSNLFMLKKSLKLDKIYKKLITKHFILRNGETNKQ